MYSSVPWTQSNKGVSFAENIKYRGGKQSSKMNINHVELVCG